MDGHAQTGVYSPSGAIRVKSGSFELAGDGSITAGNVVIDMTSIQQDSQEMQKHLKDADFFDLVNLGSYAIRNEFELEIDLYGLKQ